jgi:hypothetical protein
MHIIYGPDHHAHCRQFEFQRGELVPCVEKPEHADYIFKPVIDHYIGPVFAPDSFPLTPH